jgi:hypothetical protein
MGFNASISCAFDFSYLPTISHERNDPACQEVIAVSSHVPLKTFIDNCGEISTVLFPLYVNRRVLIA